MKRDIHVYKFDPLIYPRKVWVCLDAYPEPIEAVFKFYGDGYKDALDDCYMMVSKVTHKETGNHGVLISAASKKGATISNIAHESVHAADCIFEDLDIFPQRFSSGNEHYSYLVGWIAGCIGMAKSGHIS